MIADIDCENQYFVLVFEEKGESFINIQRSSKLYSFCPEMEMGKYRIPMISLPMLKNACCRIRYELKYTRALKERLERFTKHRHILEKAKETVADPKLQEDIEETVKMLNGFRLAETQMITLAYALLGKRILIGNEIGDGKTLTANALGYYLRQKQKVDKIIVLTSATLVDNYVNDYVKFFGNDGIISTVGVKKDDRGEIYKIFGTPNNGIHTLVTNYEKCNLDFMHLYYCRPKLVIVDEFHKIRNFISAQRSQKFFELLQTWKPEYRIPMTGTPIENMLFDLFPVFKFLNDGDIFGTQEFFERNFVEYKDIFFKIKLKNGRVMTRCEKKAVGFKNQEYLKDVIRHLVIRKKTRLPVDKYEHFEEFEMPKKVREGYKTLEPKWHTLRQYLNNPKRNAIVDNPKLERMFEILEQTSEKTVVFTFYKDTVKTISEALTEKGIKHHIITGDITRPAIEIIEEFKNDKESKVLIGSDRIQDGVNIQFARNVINFEMPIKPTTYRQRYGRVYRRGQTHDVQIYSFIYKESVESDILEMVKRKAEIIDTMIEKLDIKIDVGESKKKMQEIDEEFLAKMLHKYKIKDIDLLRASMQ